MLRQIGSVAALLLLATGCPKGGPAPADKAVPPKETPADLPAIAVEVHAEKLGPTDGHDPAAKSPLLDIMSKENA